MVTFYLCFLAGGAVLPLISVLFGSLGGGSEADLDTDMDIDAVLDPGGDVDVDPGLDAVGTHTGASDAGTDMGADLSGGPEPGGVLTIGFLPTSLMAISALAIVFGAVGSVMLLSGAGKLLTFVAAVAAGYIASVVVQTIIKTLKKVQKRNYGVNENELLMYDGKVIDTILPGQLGTVSFTTLKDVHVSYPARCVQEELKLSPGRIVKVVEIKNGIFIVEPKNKYE